MKIQLAKDLQQKFQAGLTLCGEKDNELLWIGEDKEWEVYKILQENEQEIFNIQMQKDYQELEDYNNSLKD